RGHPRVAARRRQRALEPGDELLAHPRRTALLEEEGQSRPAPRLARPVVAEEQRDRRADLGGVLRPDEGVERRGERRPARALLAADGEVEAGDVAHESRRHRDVLRLAPRAVLEASRDRHVELARQVRELAITEKERLEGGRD